MTQALSSSGGVSFNEFFYGISQQESGGNYGAVNSGSGALGKYQIMPANVPAWSQQYLGVRWTPQQFLADPAKQEALARAVLQDYYNKYGARGAAAAWYSGNPALQNDYGSQNGGPSVGTYVDQVLAEGTGHMSGPPGGGPMAPQMHNVPITTIDKTVKPAPAAPDAATSAGMDAVTAPGSGAVTAAGADAVDTGQVAAPGDPSVGVQAPPVPPAPGMPATSIGTGGSASRQLAIAAAMKFIGTPYVFGGGNGTGPSSSPFGSGVGLDCSGLVQAALAAAGIKTAHFSFDQLAMGAKTAIANLQPGDLVGMNGGDHIGIYAGNNQIIVADHTGTNVQVRSIGSNEGAFGVSLSNLFK